MANELQPLSLLFQNRLFRIPDYQRGYAWLQSQLTDFWDDLINLQDGRYHYTGLLSLKNLKSSETTLWGSDLWMVSKGFKPCHIVDGQQRLTTFVILLNEIVEYSRTLKENEGLTDRDIVLGYETLEDVVSKYICQHRPPNKQITTYYILEASGDSMVDAGIDSGDLVVIRTDCNAEIGDIVVALTGYSESTLKVYAGIDEDTQEAILEYRNQAKYPDEEIRVKQLIVQGVAKHVIKAL